jgi:hypothetical protein
MAKFPEVALRGGAMKKRHFLITGRQRIAKTFADWEPKFTRVVLWLIFLLLALAMLFDQVRDTKQTSNAAFAVTLALASVAFSYGRTQPEKSPIRAEIIFAGESLVGGAIMFLLASLLRYSSLDAPRHLSALLEWLPEMPNMKLHAAMMDGVNLLFASVAFLFFLIGLIHAQRGVLMLSGIAVHRMKGHPGNEDLFFGVAPTYAQHLTKLNEEDGKTNDAVGNTPDAQARKEA